MKRDEAIMRLRSDPDRIKKFGVRGLYLFGSTARDEARPASDVDLFVDYDPARFGLIELVGLEETLSEILGARADVATRDGLHPVLRDGIEAEAVRVF